MAVSMEKIEREAPALVSLAKKAQFSIQKRDLPVEKAKVALVLDYSGSMSHEYSSGNMQRLAERVLALATQLDDDGAIDVFIFENSATYLGEVTLRDYQGSIDRLRAGYYMGGTDYAPAFREVFRHYGFQGAGSTRGGLFRKAKPAPVRSDLPVYALFLTDGATARPDEAEAALTEVSAAPIFWKMLSIGSENIRFLQKLDDLKFRTQDNADYKPVGDLNMPDMALFDLLLDEYPEFLASSQSLGMI